MGNSPIRWLGGDIVIDDRRFCHGDNGTQEFYETIIASQRLLLGILKNHGEDIWIAYADQGKTVRTLTGCSHRSDGKLDAEPLYGTKNDPQSLAEGLMRLWREHGQGMLTLPCTIIVEQGGTMCVSATISSYLSLVPYGKHGIEMLHESRKIAVFANHETVQQNWREAVMFAIGWHQTLFYSASEAQAFATERGLVVYTWQCFGRENWLRRGATNVDAFCYTVLPNDAPESVRLADDDGDNVPQDDLE